MQVDIVTYYTLHLIEQVIYKERRDQRKQISSRIVIFAPQDAKLFRNSYILPEGA